MKILSIILSLLILYILAEPTIMLISENRQSLDASSNGCCHTECCNKNNTDKEHQTQKHNPDNCCSSHLNPFFHTCSCINGFYPVNNKISSPFYDTHNLHIYYNVNFSSKTLKPVWQPPKTNA